MKKMLHYKEIGKGEPVVLIHGFMENGEMWNSMAKKLSQEYRVIIPDLYGHGKTPTLSDKHTMEMQADAVIELLNHLEIDKSSFIGHSMGGYVSLALARDFKERVERLCLFFSFSLPDSEQKKEQRLKAIEVAQEHYHSFIKHGVRNLFNPNNLENLEEEIKVARGIGYQTPLDGISSALRGMRERGNTTHVLEEANYPVEIILGEYDSAIDSRSFMGMLPQNSNIHVQLLPIGHMGHLEAPLECLGLIQDFLER